MTEEKGVAISSLKQNQSAPSSHPSSLIAIVVGVIWLCFMLWLVMTTANPVTLNREQILRATLIVRGTVDVAKKTVTATQTWSAGPSLEEQTLILKPQNLSDAVDTNGEYLIPLTHSGDRYTVTTTRLPDEQPLIYPATEEAISQLEAILAK